MVYFSEINFKIYLKNVYQFCVKVQIVTNSKFTLSKLEICRYLNFSYIF